MIGGAGFDMNAYSLACKQRSIPTGRVGFIKNPRIKNHEGISVSIESGVPGTFGDGYFMWQSEIVNYATKESEFQRQYSMPMGSDYSQLWVNEESAMINFLLPFKSRMPNVSNYCVGDYFIIFKVIYGSSDEGGCVCAGYSRRIISILAEIGAGIESDCESHQMHFAKLRNM
jgi:hypothetical protein